MTTLALTGTLLVGHASAEEHRNVPRIGVSLTYKITITNNTLGVTSSNGLKYTYRVKYSDGVTAEGPIELTTVYRSLDARMPPPVRNALRLEMEELNAHKEGDLYAVDIQPEVTRALAKHSAFRWLYFISELSRTVTPIIPLRPGKAALDPADAQVTATRNECDKAALARFFPIGKTPHLSVPCMASADITHVPHEIHAPDQAQPIELTYEGPGKVKTRAGEWPIQKIRMMPASQGPSGHTETEMLFSEQLGAVVKQHTVINTRIGTTQTDRELIAVSQ